MPRAPTRDADLGRAARSSDAVDRRGPGGDQGRLCGQRGAFGNVQYRVFTDPSGTRASPRPSSTRHMRGPNWAGDQRPVRRRRATTTRPASDSGPNGVYLTYRYGPADRQHASACASSTRRRTPSGRPTYIEGPDPIDEQRHRRARSTRRTPRDGCTSSGARSTTATGCATRALTRRRDLQRGGEPRHARDVHRPDGRGRPRREPGSPSGAPLAAPIRVVPIDPQAEPAAPGGGGPGGGPGGRTPPGRPRVASASATPRSLPGQGTSFTLQLERGRARHADGPEAGQGPEGAGQRGRHRCVPQTRRRLRALRRQRRQPGGVPAPAAPAPLQGLQAHRADPAGVTPGRNTIVFNGRIAGRRLRPGRYRALLVITDSAGNVSRDRADPLPRAAQTPLAARPLRQECTACR